MIENWILVLINIILHLRIDLLIVGQSLSMLAIIIYIYNVIKLMYVKNK